MKPKTLWYLLVSWSILLAQVAPALAAGQAQSEAPQAWQFVAPGIDYQKFHITNNGRPVNVFVSRMDRSNPNVTVDTTIGQGRLSGGTETVIGMASRYDQSINYWNGVWGNRNNVAVAINGYFFGDPNEPAGVPWSGQIHSGWYAKRFDNTVGDAGFAWIMDNTQPIAQIGTCVTHRASKNYILFPISGYNPNIRAINIVHGTEALILYTPQYDASTRTAENGDIPKVEILVEMTRPTVIISNQDAAPLGYIRQIRTNDGSTPIPFDHIVISAWGSVGTTIQDKIASGEINVGDPVRVVQEISNCNNSPAGDWTKTYASTGGDYHFLTASVIRTDFNNTDAAVRNSRTAIAYNSSYIFFIVVDAFDLNVSEGLNVGSLAVFARDTLGATDAVSVDSGTSATMVVSDEVVNNTYCTYTRKCGMAPEPVAGSTTPTPGTPAVLPANGSYSQWDVLANQASVGNGWMMVVVEPMQLSNAFIPAQIITTTMPAEVRLGPGTNYAIAANLSAGAVGVISAHINNMNGLLAKSSFWWKVSFGGTQGWVREETLQGGLVPPVDRPYKAYLPAVNSSSVALFSAPGSPILPSPMHIPVTPAEEAR